VGDYDFLVNQVGTLEFENVEFGGSGAEVEGITVEVDCGEVSGFCLDVYFLFFEAE
jgi:hypothetical protein